MVSRRVLAGVLCALAVSVAVPGSPGVAAAAAVGQSAPNFTLPSSMGGDTSLSDFHGKKWVLLEFYGADFAPT